MTNGFLVSVPHERLHGTISILKQRPELPRERERGPLARLFPTEADECAQSAGSQRRNAAHRLLHAYRTTCTSATAGGSLALQACLAQQAGNGSPSETASMTSTWREREREREIQIVHSASLAYEDESVFTFCALLRMAVRQWLT